MVEVPITNSTYVETPIPVASNPVAEQSETNASFGLDFPNLFNPPSVAEQGSVNDPVTSGGDSATYSQQAEDEDESNGN